LWSKSCKPTSPSGAGIPFGEGVRLAGEGTQPIAQRHIESFDMHRPGPQRGAGLHRQQSSVPIALLDGLRQDNRLWDGPRRMPLFARQHQLSIGPQEHASIALPAIAERGGNPSQCPDCGDVGSVH
jgi:hypothetical protein